MPSAWLVLSRSAACVAHDDVVLAHDAAVADLEDAVGDDLPAAGERAGHGRGGVVAVRDHVLDAGLDAGAGAVPDHALEHVPAPAHARCARRVVPIDLDD